MIKIREVVKAKLVFFLFVLISFCSKGYTQEKLEIIFCDEMKDMSELQAMRIIDLTDTIVFPSIGNNLFLNPFNLCGEVKKYNRSDTSWVKVIFENSNYIYTLEMLKRDLFCSKLKVCVDKIRRGEFRYSYTNCASISFSGSVQRKKKLN